MAICVIGTGQRIGDWQVIGDGGGQFIVQRLDSDLSTFDPQTKTYMARVWHTMGSAINVLIAMQVLEILIEQENYFYREQLKSERP